MGSAVSALISVAGLRSPGTIPEGLSIAVGEALPKAVQKIVQALDPEKVILFGSYASGDPTPNSDIDLLVILKTTLPRRERSWPVSQLLLPRQFPVDILVRTPEEIWKSIQEGDHFIQSIMTQGLTLYERHK